MHDNREIAFRNYLREFLLTKDEVRKFRAKINRAFTSKETMIETLKQYPVRPFNESEITDKLFEENKIMVFRILDAYEAGMKDDSE